MATLLEVVLPVFLVIGFGYAAVWRGLFSDAGVDGLMRFTQKFAIPCLLFVAIAELDLAAHFDLRLLAAFYAGALLCFLAGMFGARALFGRPWEDCVAIGFCCLFSNSVLLGLPISERAYGPDSLSGNFAIIAVHAPICYLVGILAMEIVRNAGRTGVQTVVAVLRAMFLNALIIGIMLGFAVNLSGLPLPGILRDALDLMIRAALPAALFGLGGVLVRYRPEGDLRVVGMVAVLALAVHPAIVWGLGQALALPDAALRSGVVTAAMPPGINAYLFADMYGRARRVAATAVLVGTAATVVTAWLWLAVLP